MQVIDPTLECPRCGKPTALCVCAAIVPVATRTEVLILQHPQEPDKELGSALIAHLALPSSTLRIGLSWPNLRAALGREAQASRWAVLHLGSGVKQAGAGNKSGDKTRGKARGKTTSAPPTITPTVGAPSITFLDRKGAPLADQHLPIDGIVVLDGTWSQAKTLWWRNAWLLKLRRAVLHPSRPSLYRELRREPRPECAATIEAIAEALVAVGEPTSTGEALRAPFAALLDKVRARSAAARRGTFRPHT